MDLAAIRSDAFERWISTDGLMGLDPNSFIPRHNGSLGTTVPVDNGCLFRCLFELMCLDFDAQINGDFVGSIYANLSDGSGGILRNPGRIDEPATHDDISALACSALMFRNKLVARGLYDTYGSLWKTIRYHGPNPKRRWRAYADSSFYGLCAGYRDPNVLTRSILLTGLTMGARNVPFDDKHANEILLLWVKFEGVYRSPLVENVAYEAGAVFYKRLKEYGGIYRVVCDYFHHEEHPIRRVAQGFSQ